jgi:AmmeMemoRadiSam system protein B
MAVARDIFGEVAVIRKPAVAGTWYPESSAELAARVDGYVAAAGEAPPRLETLVALIAPHAGLKYSGPVAAFAYRQLLEHPADVAVLVGPSHFVGFEGVAVYPGGFDSPLGVAEFDAEAASAISAATPIVHEDARAHAREHSLEMQIPFLKHLAPKTRIVPLLMGYQDAATADALGEALARALAGRRAVLVASTDLSHYHDAATAATLDAVVLDHVARFDADGLQRSLDVRPEHACGGGPAVAVMRAARLLGARDAMILKYADSGDVSGDKSAVVGYLAAALGRLTAS